jgi:hypothetical protein
MKIYDKKFTKIMNFVQFKKFEVITNTNNNKKEKWHLVLERAVGFHREAEME